MKPNPYESAAQPSATDAGCRTHWYRTYLVPVSQIAFWFGAMLFVLGSFISFSPGAEAGWFGMSAALVGFGFFVPSKSYRIATLVILAICLFWTYTGYLRGIEHQEWLKNRQH